MRIITRCKHIPTISIPSITIKPHRRPSTSAPDLTKPGEHPLPRCSARAQSPIMITAEDTSREAAYSGEARLPRQALIRRRRQPRNLSARNKVGRVPAARMLPANPPRVPLLHNPPFPNPATPPFRPTRLPPPNPPRNSSTEGGAARLASRITTRTGEVKPKSL